MSRISDDDLVLSATPEERYGDLPNETVELGSVRSSDVKSIFAPANRKRLAAYVVAGSVLVGAIFFTVVGFDSPGSGTPAGGPGINNAGRVGTNVNSAPETWVQQQERERYNTEVLPELQKSDPTAHPLLDTAVVDDSRPEKIELNNETEVSSPFQANQQTSSPRTVGSAVRDDNQRQSRANVDPQVMDDLIQRLILAEGGESRPQLQVTTWSYRRTEPRAEGVGGQGAEQGGQAPVQVANAGLCARPLARAGSSEMATTDLAVNSDVGGPVSVTIRSGALRGAQLLGQFERAETWLRMTLNRMVLPDETVQISAIALDVETTLNAVQGDVDRHLMYRYGWWGLGTTLRAIGRAAERTGDSTVVVSNGTVIESTTSNTQRETRIALGELGQDIGEVMRDRLNRPITVSLKVGDEVGVFFLDDVCSKNTATAGM